MDANRILEAIRTRRDVGVVHAVFAPWPMEGTAQQRADGLVAAHGLGTLGERWRSLDRDGALLLLTNVLAVDLAYGSPVVPREEAALLAMEFVELFGRDAVFFTNGDFFVRKGGAGWTPLTGATFDTGVVALNATHAGLVWVEDED